MNPLFTERHISQRALIEGSAAQSAAHMLIAAGLDKEASGLLERVLGHADPDREVRHIREGMEEATRLGYRSGFVLPARDVA